MVRSLLFHVFLGVALLFPTITAFQQALLIKRQRQASPLPIHALKVGKGYTPKWKKKETLGGGNLSEKDKGLKGDVQVVFKTGNETIRTMALVGQPVSDVAAQAGQFIKYGCGKGECGTCESLCNGKWIRPCVQTIPGDLADGEEYLIVVKETKARAKSSGKFYSFRSFIMGFYNNLIGMVGFVKTRKAAKKNWSERQEYEDLIAQKVAEKKAARDAAAKKE
mmetsp:Transcript_18403/g.25522  ORF Transcript_18403/g.25522 Transcript_18403/m.25522 type:complete len:222 (+) Transcript_18403:116-781(+)